MLEEFSNDEFVTVFASRSHMAGVEAELIHSMFEAAGLPSIIVRDNVVQYPVGKVAVRVLSSDQEAALDLLRQAESSENGESPDAGPAS